MSESPNGELEAIHRRLDDLGQMLSLLVRAVNSLTSELQDGTANTTGHSVGVASNKPHHLSNTLYKLTTKQHGALQMLLDGRSNAEIAKRFDVSDDTAKVYVRTIAKKYGVNTRAQIVMATLEEFNSLDDDVYMRISGGLPKDWHSKYAEPDPFAELYRTKKHEPKSKSTR